MSTIARGAPLPVSPDGLLRAAWIFAPDAGAVQRFVASGLCAVLGVAATVAEAWGLQIPFWLLLILCYVAGGLRATTGALEALLERKPDINVLMILAAVVSALLGHWHEGAVLLFLFSLSDALETYAVARTRRGITALMDLRPEVARLVVDGRESTIAVRDLRVGDRLRVRPGERFPIDGVVIEGTAAADEAVVTGESLPVEKQPGSPVFAGTINVNGSLIVEMSRPATESTIARIVRLVAEAQEQKAPFQRVIERWQTPYVLGVLGAALLTIVIHALVAREFANAVYQGMVLLVAASPCAVVLASPVAVLAGVTRGARHGVLFKGGSHIERLASVETIAFDKTGTVTRGRLALTEMRPLPGCDEQALLALAAALESHSGHPIAQAIVAAAAERGIEPAEAVGFVDVAGLGIIASVNAQWAGAGRRTLFENHGVTLPSNFPDHDAAGNGETVVLVYCVDGRGGGLTLRDEVRPEAAEALRLLRSQEVRQLVMLTGDREAAAKRIAAELEIAEVRAELRPEDKLREIRRLSQHDGGVAMVGDGVNDAPALAAATVGVAMGAAGSDVAMESADVVLMRDDLRGLAEAVHLARHTRDMIRQSLLIAFGAMAGLVLLTLLGWMVLPVAVIGHEGSTVVVVLNSLRLLKLGSVQEHSPSAG